MENLANCYFCKRQSDLSCNICKKAVCFRCDKLDHCNISCGECKGKDKTSKSYILHQVCKNCKENSTESTAIVFWDSSENLEILDVLPQTSEIVRSTCVFSEISMNKPSAFELIEIEIKRHIHKKLREIFFLSEKLSPNQINELQSLSLRAGITIYIINLTMSETKQIIPIGHIDYNQLVRFFEIRLNNGKLITEYHKISSSLPHIEDLLGLLSSFNVTPFIYSYRKIDFYSLPVAIFDQKVLSYVMKALEKAGLIPLFSRIQDVLAHVFHLNITNQEISLTHKSLKERTFAFAADNSVGDNEQAISFRYPSSFVQESKSELMKMPKYKNFVRLVNSESSRNIHGIYKKAVFYSNNTNDLSFAEIFKFIEIVERSQMQIPLLEPPDEHPEMANIDEIKNLLTLTIEDKRSINIQELEQVLLDFIKPQTVKYINLGFSGFKEMVESFPELMIMQNNVLKTQLYKRELDSECPICFEEMKHSDCKLECSHSFHYECLKGFMKKCKEQRILLNCPSCRRLLSKTEKQKLDFSNTNKGPQRCTEESISLGIPNRRRCLNQSCQNKFSPGKEHLPCRFCNKIYCWECQIQKTSCKCVNFANNETSKCTLIGKYLTQGDFAVCDICESSLCILCKKAADYCSLNT